MQLKRQQLLRDLYIAYYDARRHKTKMSYVIKFEENLSENLEKLCDELFYHTYTALPSKCFIVEYPKKREVYAAQFRDRIVHHLYYNYTHQLFERTFIADSYSCIPGRGTLYGIERLTDYCRKESQNYQLKCYVMKLDIRGYFMHIIRMRLLKIATGELRKMATHRVGKSTQTWNDLLDIEFVCWLTKEIVLLDPETNCVLVGDPNGWIGLDKAKSLRFAEKGRGLPIGNLTSQLFSNVYLNLLDQYMKRGLKCKYYGRYVDDAFVVSVDKEWLLALVPRIREFLRIELGLELHMGKLVIQEVHRGVEFLGAYIKPYRTYISRRTLERIKTSLKDMPKSRENTIHKINSLLGTFSHYASYNLRKEIFVKKEYLELGVFDNNVTKITDRQLFYNLLKHKDYEQNRKKNRILDGTPGNKSYRSVLRTKRSRQQSVRVE